MKNIFSLSLFIFILFFNPQLSFAQNAASPAAKIEYQLPYPGILPDSPLYFLKAARDRIVGFLIADPLKKADFNLSVADKRLNAGFFLLKQGKEELAITTISKGENYFEEALGKLKEAKNKGVDTKALLEKFRLSAKKHQEVLEEMEKQTKPNLKERMGKELERTRNFEKNVMELGK